MTISAVVPDITFSGSSGSGTLGPFSLVKSGTPIVFYNNSEVFVYRYDAVTDTAPTLLVEGTDYTLTGGPTAGSITLTSPQTGLLTAERLYVYTRTSIAQALDLVNGGNFSSSNLERRLDIIFQILQQLDREVKSGIRFAMFDTDEIPKTLPLGAAIDKIPYVTGTASAPTVAYLSATTLADLSELSVEALANIATVAADLAGADTIGIVAAAIDDVEDVAGDIASVVAVAAALDSGVAGALEVTSTGSTTARTLGDRFGQDWKSLLDIVPANLHAAILAFTSTVDVSDYFETMLETGGRWFIPDGQYTLGPAGADTDAVLAEITKSVHIVCGPRVKIVAGSGLDGDLIRIRVPSNGAGLSAKVDVIWEGGYFDQSDQDVSTSVPFIVQYPPVNPGTSATTDGLRIEGAYDPGSGLVNGIRLAKVTGATFYCGDHWMVAGGDQSVTAGYGADLTVVRDCTFIGNRDLGVYLTPEDTATAKGFCVVENNRFVNCFGGASVKRSVNGFSISGNEFINCVVGAAGYWIAGNKTSDGVIAWNRFRGCQVNVRLDYCERVHVVNNSSDDFGALEDDGVTAVTAYTPVLINLKGSKYCVVDNNRSGGVVSAYSASNVRHVYIEDFDTGSGLVNSEYNQILNNLSDGLYSPGEEVSGEANYNRIEGNYEISGSVKNFVRNGAASSEVRYDYSTGIQTRMTPEYFDDGSASVPIIARRSANTTGFGFATNEVFATVAGSKRHRVLSTGVDAIPAHSTRAAGNNAGVQRTVNNNIVTLASGTSVTLSGARPAGSRILGVTARIGTSIVGSGGVTGIQIGDGSDADRYGVISGLTSGLSAGTLANPPTADPDEFRLTAGDIVITAVGGTFAGGTVRINVAYEYMVPAES